MNTSSGQDYLRQADSRSLDVLLWLYNNQDSDHCINTTLDEVAKECEVTKVTVNRVFQRLYKSGHLSKVRNGMYQLLKV
jgi:predicted transcriptional regulator of viral defense system